MRRFQSLILAHLSGSSLPVILLWPGTHSNDNLLVLASFFRAKWHSYTALEVKSSPANAIKAATSEFILMVRPCRLLAMHVFAHSSRADTSAWKMVAICPRLMLNHILGLVATIRAPVLVGDLDLSVYHHYKFAPSTIINSLHKLGFSSSPFIHFCNQW